MLGNIIGATLAAFLVQNSLLVRFGALGFYEKNQKEEKEMAVMTAFLIILMSVGYTAGHFSGEGIYFVIFTVIFFLGELFKVIKKEKNMIRIIKDSVRLSLVLVVFLDFEKSYLYNLFSILVIGFFFFVLGMIFGSINERFDYLKVPSFLEGTPIKFVTFSLAVMIFYAFAGFKF